MAALERMRGIRRASLEVPYGRPERRLAIGGRGQTASVFLLLERNLSRLTFLEADAVRRHVAAAYGLNPADVAVTDERGFVYDSVPPKPISHADLLAHRSRIAERIEERYATVDLRSTVEKSGVSTSQPGQSHESEFAVLVTLELEGRPGGTCELCRRAREGSLHGGLLLPILGEPQNHRDCEGAILRRVSVRVVFPEEKIAVMLGASGGSRSAHSETQYGYAPALHAIRSAPRPQRTTAEEGMGTPPPNAGDGRARAAIARFIDAEYAALRDLIGDVPGVVEIVTLAKSTPLEVVGAEPFQVEPIELAAVDVAPDQQATWIQRFSRRSEVRVAGVLVVLLFVGYALVRLLKARDHRASAGAEASRVRGEQRTERNSRESSTLTESDASGRRVAAETPDHLFGGTESLSAWVGQRPQTAAMVLRGWIESDAHHSSEVKR